MMSSEKIDKIFIKKFVDDIIKQSLLELHNTEPMELTEQSKIKQSETKRNKAKQSRTITYDKDSKSYLFSCPHCCGMLQVMENQINCKIFRHATYKSTHLQIPPHSTKQTCEKLFKTKMVYGCAKPFLFDGKTITATNEYT